MTIRTISQSDSKWVLELNGEYRVRVRRQDDLLFVTVAMRRTRALGNEAAARLEQVARRRGALVRVEPIIDGSMLVVREELWQGVLDEVAAQRLWPGRAEDLSVESAHEAVLHRLIASGGEMPWEDVVPQTMEADSFPLGYRGRDAVHALLATRTLKKVPHPVAPRLRVNSAD